MHKTFLIAGSFFAGLAVLLGAFGAHALQKMVDAKTVVSFQTGVQYQMYHAFALLIAGMLYERFPGSLLSWAGNLFIGGIILFSGSLYLITAIKSAGREINAGIGIITPIGGLLFIAGWLLAGMALSKR